MIHESRFIMVSGHQFSIVLVGDTLIPMIKLGDNPLYQKSELITLDDFTRLYNWLHNEARRCCGYATSD